MNFKVNQGFKNIISGTAIFLLIISVLLCASSCKLLRNESLQEGKEEIPDGLNVTVEVIEGMTLTQVSQLLEEKGVVDNAFLFRLYVEQMGKEGNLIPGTYEVVTGSSQEEILDKLTQGPQVVTYRLAIPEGFTVSQVMEKTVQEIPFTNRQDLENAADIKNYNYEYLGEAGSLEGFLFPKTYELLIDYTARNIIEMMLAQY
ncbi:MAG: endolytic transglycosylase MltG, partial [Actinobacteria bacterium]|nr:endolytic transglycosylase MltG [Actinomycetota bacterium]